ncbi:MAG: hypothetical protein JWP69_2128 [Flaviaesturariibacter sp.]|nr:hypothetical protein [Flaviaesturariibacter sp.]
MIMKSWILLITIFFSVACKSPQLTQSSANPVSTRKEEKADMDSLYIVHSLPISVSHSTNFKQTAIHDSLVVFLKERKYKPLDEEAFKQLLGAKMMETSLAANQERAKEMLQKMKTEEDYFRLLESTPPYLQLVQLSFLKNDAGLNSINVRRINMPQARKSRNWVFTYPDSEPAGQVASHILDSLIKTKRAQ